MGVAVEVKTTAPTSLHVAFAALGIAFLAIFSWVLFHEGVADWRTTQARFRRLETTVKNPHQLAQAASVGGLRQFWLPDLDRVDRCETCHLGIDDPAFAGAPQPFKAHPGTWLTTHPVDRFGCTSATTDRATPPTTRTPHISRCRSSRGRCVRSKRSRPTAALPPLARAPDAPRLAKAAG